MADEAVTEDTTEAQPEAPVETTPAPTTKKKGVCQKVYVDGDGNETRSATDKATELQFRFTNGETRTVDLTTFPENIATNLQWFGRSEKLGNFYAGAKGDADVAVAKFDAGMELLVGGEWVEKGVGVGTAPSLIVEAIVRALTASGEEVDEDRLNAIREKCKDKDTRNGAKKDPAIMAHVKAIEAERAAERAVKAQEAAEGTAITTEGF